MNKQALLKVSTVLMTIYIGLNFIKSGLFCSNSLITWTAIYFVMAYMKLYMSDFMSSMKANAVVFISAIIGHIVLILSTNFLSLHMNLLSDKMLHWVSLCNPFLLLIALSAFNMFRKIQWENVIVNRIAGLSMLVYIIHENIILRSYYRTWAVNYIYEKFGYSHIILWTLLLCVAIFVISVCISWIYTLTLQKVVRAVSKKLCSLIGIVYSIYESLVYKIG